MFRLREYIYLSIHSILVGTYIYLFISYTILSSSSSDLSSVLPNLSLPPPKGIVPSSPIFILYLSVLTYTYLYSSVPFYPNIPHSFYTCRYLYILTYIPIISFIQFPTFPNPLIHSILVDTYIYLLIFLIPLPNIHPACFEVWCFVFELVEGFERLWWCGNHVLSWLKVELMWCVRLLLYYYIIYYTLLLLYSYIIYYTLLFFWSVLLSSFSIFLPLPFPSSIPPNHPSSPSVLLF